MIMIAVVMPKLGLTMTEGTIQQWLKAEGDSVERGEAIAEIETDKSTAAVEAPAAGKLWGIQFPESGTEVEVGTTIAYLLEEGELPPKDMPAQTATPDQPEISETSLQTERPITAGSPSVKSSPAARKLAEQRGIDLSAVMPDQNGIIHLAQVEAASRNAEEVPRATPLARAVAKAENVDLSKLSAPENRRIRVADVVSSAASQAESVETTQAGDQEIPFQGMRKTIAKRMSQSKREVPHFYLKLRADMTRANALMARQREKVSLHDLLIRVLAQALAEHPSINAHVYEDRVVHKREIHIGVAVATDRGLIVPVVRNVVGKSLSAIASESKSLIQKAREGSLAPDEYQGGTFTISNLGMFGIEEFTAIINQPEAAILAVGRTVDTPVWEDGVVKPRPMLALTASYDHRAVDGVDGAKFLRRIKELLEDPELLI